MQPESWRKSCPGEDFRGSATTMDCIMATGLLAECSSCQLIYVMFHLPTVLQREGFSKFNKIYEFDCHMLGRVCLCVLILSLVPTQPRYDTVQHSVCHTTNI